MQNFRRLEVWQRAHSFAVPVRGLVRGFPRTGCAELKSQLTKGCRIDSEQHCRRMRSVDREGVPRFLDISIKSTSETEYRLQLAKDYRVLSPRRWSRAIREVIEIRKMICGLRKQVLARNERPRNEDH